MTDFAESSCPVMGDIWITQAVAEPGGVRTKSWSESGQVEAAKGRSVSATSEDVELTTSPTGIESRCWTDLP